jgi:hypothetical protein
VSTPDAPHTPPPGPVAPQAPAAVVPMSEVARPKRRALPWIIAGVVVALLAVAAAVVWFVVLPLVGGGSARGPQDAVLAYDQAYDEQDCALYQRVTTPGFQETLAPTCDDFAAVTQTFLDSYTDYDVEITQTDITGSTARVTTTESWVLDGEPASQEYVYTLVLADGAWRIDGLE